MTVFETTGQVALRVSLEGGEVDVTTRGGGGVEVELVALRDNEITKKAIAEARLELQDRGSSQDVVVELKRKSGLLVGRGPKVGVRIVCPHGSDLTLRAGSADLDVSGELGAVDVKTASGSVSLEDVAALSVSTASGDVRVRNVAGATDVHTASGDAAIHRSGGLLTANLVSGDLLVDEAAAGFALSTVSGEVRVHAAGGGGMRAQSVSGDVRLAIRPGELLKIDASSVSGTMRSELAVEDTPPPADGAGPVRELHVRTISGDLQITRAAAAGA